MYKYKVAIVTGQDVHDFVRAISNTSDDTKVYLSDDDCVQVSAKSLLGVIYTLEWSQVYCYSNKPISDIILPWIVEEDNG